MKIHFNSALCVVNLRFIQSFIFFYNWTLSSVECVSYSCSQLGSIVVWALHGLKFILNVGEKNPGFSNKKQRSTILISHIHGLAGTILNIKFHIFWQERMVFELREWCMKIQSPGHSTPPSWRTEKEEKIDTDPWTMIFPCRHKKYGEKKRVLFNWALKA